MGGKSIEKKNIWVQFQMVFARFCVFLKNFEAAKATKPMKAGGNWKLRREERWRKEALATQLERFEQA